MTWVSDERKAQIVAEDNAEGASAMTFWDVVIVVGAVLNLIDIVQSNLSIFTRISIACYMAFAAYSFVVAP